MKKESHISLIKVNKSYQEGDKERSVLDDLELTVNEGEMIVLLGRSGSGKSTMLNLISGIDRPDSGQINIGGTDLAQLNEKDRTLFSERMNITRIRFSVI
ncbi:MAG: ATP-binding cassette domain-containing protein [Gracilimonas sp.]|nr:ATP-binding cassette domain-containing protein [Gracilimonas sp.]